MGNRPSDPAYDAALLMEPERTRLIIGAFFYVYNRLRFGLLLHFGPEAAFDTVIVRR